MFFFHLKNSNLHVKHKYRLKSNIQRYYRLRKNNLLYFYLRLSESLPAQSHFHFIKRESHCDINYNESVKNWFLTSSLYSVHANLSFPPSHYPPIYTSDYSYSTWYIENTDRIFPLAVCLSNIKYIKIIAQEGINMIFEPQIQWRVTVARYNLTVIRHCETKS